MNDSGVANDYNIAVRQFKQQILPGGIWNTINGRTDAFLQPRSGVMVQQPIHCLIQRHWVVVSVLRQRLTPSSTILLTPWKICQV
jgi:hypothetical protein